MKTLEQIQEFYESELKQTLAAMEQDRQKMISKAMTVTGIIGVVGLVVGLLITQMGAHNGVLLLIVLGICVAIGAGAFSAANKNYKAGYKSQIIHKLITFAQPGLEYWPDGGISKEIFTGSKLFTHSIDRYRCEDLVRGKVDKTEILFSEIHAEYKTTSGTGKDRRTEWHTIFKGLFVAADFNKHFRGRTVVLPDTAQKAFGLFGQTLQSWNPSRDELIRLEDVEFEKEFVVYGTNQIESRYILSPALMERIVEFRRRLRDGLYLSFIGSKVYVAIPLETNLFEPKTFSSAAGFESIKEYYNQLRFGLAIVDELNLNTRIWTKE
ncbi:MAG: DUF3137 domain-containing protein [Sedimentisphaerales bacterium]|nr:DUF3137 domain-containing protein [Sedimentisphaerales bacterium]